MVRLPGRGPVAPHAVHDEVERRLGAVLLEQRVRGQVVVSKAVVEGEHDGLGAVAQRRQFGDESKPPAVRDQPLELPLELPRRHPQLVEARLGAGFADHVVHEHSRVPGRHGQPPPGVADGEQARRDEGGAEQPLGHRRGAPASSP